MASCSEAQLCQEADADDTDTIVCTQQDSLSSEGEDGVEDDELNLSFSNHPVLGFSYCL